MMKPRSSAHTPQGRYVFSPQQLYGTANLQHSRAIEIAGYDTLLPVKGSPGA